MNVGLCYSEQVFHELAVVILDIFEYSENTVLSDNNNIA